MHRQELTNRLYLPLFYDLTGRSVLIVGGGKAAWQKVKALAAFGPPVTVVSPDFLPELETRATEPDSGLTLVRKPWAEADLDAWLGALPVGLVLACTGDFAVNNRVVFAARERGLLVLDAARPDKGDFIQPATRRSGTFTLAVSSGGTGPKRAVTVRDALVGPFEEAIQSLGD